MVENPLVNEETQVQSLDGECPLGKEMATHSSILACKIPGAQELEGYSPRGHKRARYD